MNEGRHLVALLVSLQFSELFEDLLDVRFFADIVNVDIFNDAILIDDEHRALAHAGVLAQHAVRFCNRTMRPKIAEQWELDPAHRLRPRFIRVRAVDRDAQDLGI